MLYGAKEGKLKTQNFSMDYITFGKGAKPLVMIQGLNTRGIKGSAIMLAYMYRLFAKDYTVYLFDRRDDLDPNVTVRMLANDTAEAMDALHITTADIIGVSQGGMIAQYLAIDRPDLVNKLVLAVTMSKNNDTVKSVINSWVNMTKQSRFSELVQDMAQKMYSPDYVKKYKLFMPLLTLLQKPKDVPRFLALANACLTCSAYEQLEKIKCPVFVIGGEKDMVVGSEAGREIADKLNCSLYLYKDLGHAAYEEAPDFNQRIYDFLTQ